MGVNTSLLTIFRSLLESNTIQGDSPVQIYVNGVVNKRVVHPGDDA